MYRSVRQTRCAQLQLRVCNCSAFVAGLSHPTLMPFMLLFKPAQQDVALVSH
jgi:hypothetical protein